jgi:hypothetical protein
LTYLAKISSLLLFDSINSVFVLVFYYKTLWNGSFSKYVAYFMVSALNVSLFPLFHVPINWFLCTFKRAMELFIWDHTDLYMGHIFLLSMRKYCLGPLILVLKFLQTPLL